MSTLNQLRRSLGRTLENLAEGWQNLRERAGQALTHFRPPAKRDDLDTWEDQVIRHSADWGLLATEVQEDGESVIVRMEVPGMEKADFDIDVIDNHLVVRGEKRVQKERRDGRFHVMECAYGSFERALALPVEVDGHAADARYRRGILTVTLP
jgi:HSP20 family protein